MSRRGIAALTVLLVIVLALTIVVLHNALGPLIAIGAVIGLVAGGNALYGKDNHYARAYGRQRPANQAPRPPLSPLPPAPEDFTVPDTLDGLAHGQEADEGPEPRPGPDPDPGS
jgi:hypothetical protein